MEYYRSRFEVVNHRFTILTYSQNMPSIQRRSITFHSVLFFPLISNVETLFVPSRYFHDKWPGEFYSLAPLAQIFAARICHANPTELKHAHFSSFSNRSGISTEIFPNELTLHGTNQLPFKSNFKGQTSPFFLILINLTSYQPSTSQISFSSTIRNIIIYLE